MLIKNITLVNFRQYIGKQTIAFSTDKQRNVTVLIGMNTSGKTTLIRAFEWILYRKNEFDDKILLNQNIVDQMSVGETQEVVGSICLEHGGKDYEITRRQTYTCIGPQKVRASVERSTITYLQPDGQTRTEIGTDFETNIESILPRALSPYFFFGGERIGGISHRDDIESSVKGLMGLDILANAMVHLKAVIAKFRKGLDFSGNQKAQDAQKRFDVLSEQLIEINGELSNAQEQLTYYREQRDNFAAQLKAHEETAENQRKRETLNTIIKNLEDSIVRRRRAVASAFSSGAFAYLSTPMLKEAITLLDEISDETESVPEMTAASIEYIIKRGVCICGTHIQPGTAAEQHLRAEQKKQPPESIGALVRRYRETGMEFLAQSEGFSDRIQNEYAELRKQMRELGFRRDERDVLDKKLKNAKDVGIIEEKFQAARRRVTEFEKQERELTRKIGAIEAERNQMARQVELLGRANTKNARISELIEYTQAVLDWITKAYTEKESVVRNKLEERVNANFSKMYHGSRSITIDDKYRVRYVDVTTEESEGLKAVKSFAFVAGLVDLAKEALNGTDSAEADIGPQLYPLVMDAPFSNVDETHIRNIADILPRAAEQVIMAVMQKDWEPAASIMEPCVGISYAIIKDTDAEGKPIDTMTHIKEVHAYV